MCANISEIAISVSNGDTTEDSASYAEQTFSIDPNASTAKEQWGFLALTSPVQRRDLPPKAEVTLKRQSRIQWENTNEAELNQQAPVHDNKAELQSKFQETNLLREKRGPDNNDERGPELPQEGADPPERAVGRPNTAAQKHHLHFCN